MPVTDPAQANLALDPTSSQNYNAAAEGQWFIGVVDTVNGTVYLLPINPRGTDTARSNTGQRNHNRYASGSDGRTPRWTGCTSNWMSQVAGNTTHTKCIAHFTIANNTQINVTDCLGFTLIKLTRAGDFGLLKATSTSLNQNEGGLTTHGPSHSFSRATHSASAQLARDSDNLPYNDDYVPGSTQTGNTRYASGTWVMGQAWRDKLKQFFAANGIPNMAVSMD